MNQCKNSAILCPKSYLQYLIMTTRRRLLRDFQSLAADPADGVSGTPSDTNIMLWNAVIFGPQETPFVDGTLKLSLEFSKSVTFVEINLIV